MDDNSNLLHHLWHNNVYTCMRNSFQHGNIERFQLWPLQLFSYLVLFVLYQKILSFRKWTITHGQNFFQLSASIVNKNHSSVLTYIADRALLANDLIQMPLLQQNMENSTYDPIGNLELLPQHRSYPTSSCLEFDNQACILRRTRFKNINVEHRKI